MPKVPTELNIYNYRLYIAIYLTSIIGVSLLPESLDTIGRLLESLAILVIAIWMYKCGTEMERIGSLGLPKRLLLVLCGVAPILGLTSLLSYDYFELHSAPQLIPMAMFILNFFIIISILIYYKAILEQKLVQRPKDHYVTDFISFAIIVIAMYQVPKLLTGLDNPGHNIRDSA